MDGLLLDTVPAYVSAMVAAGHDVGNVVSQDYVLSLVGLLGAELEAQLRSDRGPSFPVADYLTADSVRLRPMLDAGDPLKAGAAPLLEELAQAGTPMAIGNATRCFVIRAAIPGTDGRSPA